MQVLHDRFEEDAHASVLGVHWEDRGNIAEHMRRGRYTFRLIPNGSNVWRQFEVVRFPTILVVGPDGRIVYNRAGTRITDAIRDELTQVVRSKTVKWLPPRKSLD